MAEQAYTVTDTTNDEKKPSQFPEIAIGIDIGTSQCSAAVWNGSQIELLRTTRNQKLIRSYVTFKDKTPASGVSHQLSHELEMLSGAVIFNMKRLIGRTDTDPVVHTSKSLPFLVQTLDIGARPFVAALVNNVWKSTTPEEVLGIYLVELRSMAEIRLKRTVGDVVLTVPVSFNRFQLSRIERACNMAGLRVLRLMPEPTAVALLYAQQQQRYFNEDNRGSGTEKIALIFNMGGGYCDVVITATAGGVSQIKALSGGTVGGEDLLRNTMENILPDLENKDDIKSMGLLRVATQDAIHRLSLEASTQIDVDIGNGVKIGKILTRDEFEEINKEVFGRCETIVRECLREAKVRVEDVNDLILVGGCSNIPKVKNLVMGICKKEEIYKEMNPLVGAVCGAALEGAVASGFNDPFGSLDLLTIQATPMSVGIRTNGNAFVPIINRNAAVPSRRDLFFTTIRDNQTEALIVVYEGDEQPVEKNNLLGYFKITGIPLAPKGVPEINICMDIDASNALRVFGGVLMPGSKDPVGPFMEVRMPNVDDGHGWCDEALARKYGSDLDLIVLPKKN